MIARDEILRQAALIVTGPRQEDYGDASESFERIARLWSAYLNGCPIGKEDVAVMMMLLKVSRLLGSDFKHLDSWIDACGYLALGGELSGAEEDDHD